MLDAVQGAALKGLVDQNTADIAQLNGNFYKQVSGVDIETLEPGDYYCSSTCTNLPERAYCVVSVITWLAGEKAVVALSVATNIMYSRFFVNGEWRDWASSNEEQIIVTKIPDAETHSGRITVTKMGKVVIISFANFFLTTQEIGFVVASGLPRNDTGEIVLTTLFTDAASDSFSNSRCCAYVGSGQTQLQIHEFSPNVRKYGNIVYFTND